MHRSAVRAHFHMQQAALLEAVVGHIFMLVADDRPAGEQRVAVLPMLGEGIGAVHRLVALGRQKLGLRHVGPALEIGASRRCRLRTSCRQTMSASSCSTASPRL
jgi:hypothetical protein